MLLGDLPGFFSVGEIRFFWQFVEEEEHLCGCGRRLAECPFWQVVIEDLMAQEIVFSEIAALTRRIDRSRHGLWMDRIFPREFQRLRQATQILYSTVLRRSESSCLIDSSKSPAHLRLLLAAATGALHVIRLVRDGRAVAHAWSRRRKDDPGVANEHGTMPYRNSKVAAFVWLWESLLTTILAAGVERQTLLRYEDLAADPRAQLRRVLADLGFRELAAGDLGLLSPGNGLQASHSVGGNPARFERCSSVFEPSSEWKRDLRGLDRFLVTLVALPGLLHYGYPLLRGT